MGQIDDQVGNVAEPEPPARAERPKRGIPQQMSAAERKKRSRENIALLELSERGSRLDEIAAAMRMTVDEVKDRIRRLRTPTSLYLRAARETMLDHWQEAAATGAEQGKHAPARDWLIAAGEIQPLTVAAQTNVHLQFVHISGTTLPGVDLDKVAAANPVAGQRLPAAPDDEPDA